MLGAAAAIVVMAGGCSLWGWGDYYSLGDGHQLGENEHTPVQVGTSDDWAIIARGVNVCGIKTDRSLWCWGRSQPIGDGSGAPTSTATHIGTATWKYVGR